MDKSIPTYGTLYLFPNVLGAGTVHDTIPAGVIQKLHGIVHFIVENEKAARQFLKAAGTPIPQSDLRLTVIEKHDAAPSVKLLLAPLLEGNDTGLLSDAGMPAIADPGSDIVRAAHEAGIRVVPLTGPSSLLLALAASGLHGQRFCFHGYLPVNKSEKTARIRQLEKESKQFHQTQLFIETPYRNNAMLADLLEACQGHTLLCVAADLTLPTEQVQTMRITLWKKNKIDLHKRPAVFLLLQQ